MCNSSGTKCDCVIEYFKDPAVNAVCCCNNSKNKIIIYEGTLLSIYKYASILSCLYNTIELKIPENKERYHIFQINTMDENEDLEKNETELILSESKTSNLITDYIAMLAIKIIISHEVGHLLCGHIPFREAYGDKEITFSMSNTSSIVPNKSLQALEIDADQFSACQMMTILEGELLNDDSLLNILDKKQIYKLLGVSIQIVFFLIGINNNFWTVDNPFRYTHPQASTRINLFLDTLRNQIDKESEWSQIINGIVIAQKNIYDYFGSDYCDPFQFIIDIMGVDKHGKILLSELSKIQNELMNLSILKY